MAITEAQLAAKIKAAMDFNSDDPQVNIDQARQHLADEIAQGVAEFVIGRQTLVSGVQPGGATATGIIQG